MGGPALGVGDGVVEVAVDRGVVAAGKATGQIAAAHEIGQRCRGHISRLGWASPGCTNGTSRADLASSVTSSAGMSPSALTWDPGARPTPVMPACSAMTWMVTRVAAGLLPAAQSARAQRQPSRSAPPAARPGHRRGAAHGCVDRVHTPCPPARSSVCPARAHPG